MRILILIILIYLLYRLIRGYAGRGRDIERTEDGGVIDEMVQDPFCKTYIPRRDSVRRVVGGKAYYFCSLQCADDFEKEADTLKG